MRRADRLFQIVQYLRGGRLVRARQLSEWLEVSERTIYRDVADLQASGVPIEGAAGVGYIMRDGYDLPPLMFTRDEIVALLAGARLIRAWGGAAMARAAEEAMIKIDAVIPEKMRVRQNEVEIHAFAPEMTAQVRDLIDRLEAAADTRKSLSVAYMDGKGDASRRVIRPLGLWFWGKVWTLVAWCELRRDFRMFRLDRMSDVEETGETFRPEPGKTLKDFYRSMEQQGYGRSDA
ncbi:MAG: YafY family protein [Roseibium album]|uniref:HTH domain protein n=1 Tax=Roseibium album TaxID=311410 RepID=A0A0M7AHS0_9HYPH|nr:YafY family protein [Roseibium album]MBG6143448.1 putative DNA-binding transcriptional regulator YafY [Labrenzia sp. EL_142]MBG6158786.1 putative DNA-binding transcriptional regulator YafY [Labrenzia sp. EL_162]MBG6175462.1 putative DNA-binding transcriptional regulator YafY [Labrenzia sp. EL_132]MBG6197320.1 putative DNA-binding transcriptional regulator YafY [Labrenzia sp. EL_159]MBG6203742.1 putative DNA-binding transcriptional regulator YafY [Labrenzia sp. EL_13]MBG6206536.1 putative D